MLFIPHYFSDCLKDLAEQSKNVDDWNASRGPEALEDPDGPGVMYDDIIKEVNAIVKTAEKRQKQGRLTVTEYAQILLIGDTIINELDDPDDDTINK